MYGLQYLEKTVEESLSKLSLNDLGIIGQAEYMAEHAKEKVGVTRALISAVLAAVMLDDLEHQQMRGNVRKGPGQKTGS